jgi:mannose-6-phosphate isomerase-like protein (cupin superfamily)
MEKVNEDEKEYRHKTYGPKYLFRGPLIDVGVMILGPNNELGAHYHEKVEETFFFLEGTGVMRINDKEYSIGPGDAFRISPHEIHNIYSIKEQIKAVFIKTPYLPKDKISV